MSPITYSLSLGSNQGDRRHNLLRAIKLLNELGQITAISSLYQTEPMDMPAGSSYFYNLVLRLKTSMQPQDLLAEIKEIEKRLGRNLAHSHNRPRTIDIDILLADQLLVNSETLSIPHPAMTGRPFVMVPLEEIAGYTTHPVEKKSIKDLLKQLNPIEGVKKIIPLPGMEKNNAGQEK